MLVDSHRAQVTGYSFGEWEAFEMFPYPITFTRTSHLDRVLK